MDPVVTVGLDGSPESLAAARWAADEAERRKLTLRLLHAWPLLVPEPTRLPCEVDQNYWAKRLVHDARAKLQARHPGLTVVGSLIADDAEHALLRAATETGEDVPTPTSHGGVVVALKLHGSCDDLLAFAFGTAAARNVDLRTVHGRSVPIHAQVPWGIDHDITEEIRQDAQKRLSQALRPWREKFPHVDVADTIALDSPAKAVVRAAEGAGMLVVGRRRHHAALAPRLGPVAQAAIHHARCPVAVVPHD
ncbi:universal stress protein [Streptomyces sp. TP-A0356]|uniref:universal stress protein n=1 Tax=Streptomyces sp. TP-A0356 TaxID=1359208 RepID=UPI0006E1648D|nr:universal stress protein [Streptomyces sp. TP-A0356]